MRSFVLSALEDASPKGESKKALETELVIYAKVTNPTGLDECTAKERHVQAEGSFSTGPRCRVRHTNRGGEDIYEFTYKLKTQADNGGSSVEASTEHTVNVDKDFFDDFLKNVAERVTIKTRFIFDSKSITMTLQGDDNEPVKVEIPNVQYEVDVFDGQPPGDEMWCKIDLEVDNIINFMTANYPQVQDIKLTATITTLPFQPDNIMLAHSEDADVKNKIKYLWDFFAKQLKSVE